MTSTDTRQAVFAHIQRFYFVDEHHVAAALGITVLEALDALLSLEREDADVITRDGVIGYIGHTDRAYLPSAAEARATLAMPEATADDRATSGAAHTAAVLDRLAMWTATKSADKSAK